MFCPNCGNQIPDDSVFCSFCGSNLQMNTSYAPPVNLEEQSVSSFASVLRKALSSTKFLVMCILVTAAAVLSFAPTKVVVDEMNSTATTSGFDLFAILSTIAMWITYANAKNSEAVMSVSGLKFNAGIAKATFVLNWIGAGIIFVCGIVLCAVGPLLASVYVDEAVLESFYEEITPLLDMYGLGSILAENISVGFIVGFFIGMGIALIIMGIIMILLNVFYYGKVSKFAKNLHISYITNKVTDLRFSTISTWFMVMGIFEIIGSLSSFAVNPVAALGAVAGAVAVIIASTWVKELSEAVAYVPQPIETM